MIGHFENINLLWAWLIIDELVRNDINYFCISPGARSTPLTVAVARNPGARYIICNDERGAAYHALGYSKGCSKPAVVISTSGTAVANYFPAVVESSFDLVPFIILSADRPHELRATGANQTIQQTNIFGDYLRWQFDLPCPNENVAPEVVLTTVDQAIYRAIHGPAGPVHLNCPFREPLAPITSEINPDYLNTVKNWLNNAKPYTLYSTSHTSLNSKDLNRLTTLINDVKKGILVVGHLRTSEERKNVQALSELLQWPLFADILSGIRLGNNHKYLISNYDQLLSSEKFCSALQPEMILQLGGQITSKRLLKYLEKLAPEKYILVTNNPFRFDPIHRVTWRIESSLSAFYQNLKGKVTNHLDKNWFNGLIHQSQVIKNVVNDLLCSGDTISEPAVAQIISKTIPQNHSLFLASSLPIREMDMFSDFSEYPIRVTANRGASGIDGIIASATGYASGLQQPVTILIGDLALLHDLNSLMLVQSISQPVIIVVLNNQGGGIFSFLPIAEFKDIFETFFGTPHSYTFKHIAKMFHLDYFVPENKSDFSKIYLSALGEGKSAIVEIRTNRDENFDFQKKIQDRVMKELEKI
jgi:2-succinyl-5-enolpyruvyl-6-hydroxy-3-cyclohexene-1-carboxylate synthase